MQKKNHTLVCETANKSPISSRERDAQDKSNASIKPSVCGLFPLDTLKGPIRPISLLEPLSNESMDFKNRCSGRQKPFIAKRTCLDLGPAMESKAAFTVTSFSSSGLIHDGSWPTANECRTLFVYRRARSLLTGPRVYAVRVYQTILRAQNRATGKRGLMSPDQSPLRQSPAKRCAPCRAKAPFTSVRKRVCRAFYVFADRLSAHFECPVLSVSTQGVSSPPPRANGNYGIG